MNLVAFSWTNIFYSVSVSLKFESKNPFAYVWHIWWLLTTPHHILFLLSQFSTKLSVNFHFLYFENYHFCEYHVNITFLFCPSSMLSYWMGIQGVNVEWQSKYSYVGIDHSKYWTPILYNKSYQLFCKFKIRNHFKSCGTTRQKRFIMVFLIPRLMTIFAHWSQKFTLI